MHFRRRFSRKIILASAVLFLLFNILEVFHVLYSQRYALRDADLRRPLALRRERIFIASLQHNSGPNLRYNWNGALLNLINALGEDNVYVSIHESDSGDSTKDALKELDQQLDILEVPRTITLSNETHEDAISEPDQSDGWVDTARGRKERRRIPYLAHLRNLSLQPMFDMAASGEMFDRILFLNAIVFSAEDVLRLLNTNNGEYAAACSLDFAEAPHVFDSFALRESDGQQIFSREWPYFRSHDSRRAVQANEPTPVKSCWNGMVFMSSEPFLKSGLRFRGIPDSLAAQHLEASESCLIHADNPESSQKGVFVNPTVRVGYNWGAYEAMKADLSLWQIFSSLWKDRVRRWMTWSSSKDPEVATKLRKWTREGVENKESGSFCLIDDMQVLADDGWEHV
ncbi:hypothetical protein BS50DRAFT_546043 [Corynespora cassiicola Philippines]|uniref:Polysaccharide export protein n=1 Tax=Corynespora cassiicola Philippines TaxID=1448308 RepID=A0A2T2P020_CORCC|nr:hypothetical protein BS50DRAFT_546043 [Corynespora cassiicola Philippines]